MKTKILFVIAAAGLFASCKKSDKPADVPKQDFIQLQIIEHENGYLRFEFNNSHQLTKVKQLARDENDGEPALYQYTDFNYVNGQIATADYFQLSESGRFFKRTVLKYHPDPQKRIGYIARTWFYENGSTERKDTVEFTFNVNDKVVGVEFNAENYHGYSYDERGNLKATDSEERTGNDLYSYKGDFRYDNNINPFAVNGLGLYIFSVYYNEPFLANALLSTNNPVYVKNVFGHTIFGEDNQPTYNSEESFLSEMDYVFDTQGGLRESAVRNSFEVKENGQKVDGYVEHTLIRYTCLKKKS
ncbi:MAG: hypothetical protein ACTHMC_05570 [Pseudobacter sp.]|uniref:hypothetical protein n=1 Tax=Pseudobacter sp. TaxID=2045420 RepID=UPI003F800BFB